MAKYSSKDVAFILADGYALHGDATRLAESHEAVLEDLTALSDAWLRFQAPGLRRASLETEGFYDDRADGELAAFLGQQDVARVLTWSLDGNAVGRRLVGAAGAFRARLERIASLGQHHKLRGEWTITGALDARGLLLHPLSAETASGNGSAVDNGAATTAGGAGYLQVTDVAGSSPSLSAKIQHSADNVTYADLITFNAATARSAQRLVASGTVNRYLRAVWTITGTSPSFTFVVGFARY